MTKRSCSERGCGAPITHQSKTGRCRPCANRRMHADPAYQERRLAGLAAYYDKPGVRERHGRRFDDWRANMPDEHRARLRERGYMLVEKYLSRPDVRARSQCPEARARAVAAYIETRMGWCPPDLRPDYHRLIRQHVPAAEARRIIEAEIPGTAEHAKREIASRELAAQLRHERALRDAY